MAQFNPDVPKVQPGDYTKTFSPISDVPGNKAIGTAIASAGQIFGASVDALDAIKKEDLKKEVRSEMEPIMRNQVASLEVLRNGVSGTAIPTDPAVNPNQDAPGVPNTSTWATNTYGYTPKSAGTATDLLPANQPKEVPASIQNGLDKLGTLNEALAQGKINDTYYTQQLDAAVVKLRAKNPGYVDYIDEQVSKVTGIMPANAYMRNMMEDINRNADNLKTSRNKIETAALTSIENGNQALIPVYVAYKNGKATDLQLLTSISQGNAKKYQFEQDKLEIENYTTNRTLQGSMAKDAFTNHANYVVSNALKTYSITAGLDTAQDAATFLARVKSGEIKATEQQMIQLAQALDGAERTVDAQLYQESIKPGRNGKSLTDYMGVDERDKIKASAVGIYKIYKQGIMDKEFGTAVYSQKMAEAYQNAANLRIMENKDIGPIAATIGALTQKFGPQLMGSAFGQVILNGFDTKIGGAMKAFTSEKIVQSWEQPDVRASRGLGPRSLKADVEDAAKKDLPGNSGVYDDLLDNVAKVSSKDTPDDIKSAILKYSFDPRNIGVIRNFNMDYKDPKTGNIVPGKLAAFTRLTSPDITEEVWRLSAKEPQLWKDYQKWAETAFGADLFREKIDNLNKLQSESSMEIHVAWDSDKKEFSLMGKDKQPLKAITRVDQNYVNYANETVRDLNQGLQTLGRIQDVKNIDTGAYLLRVLSDAGYVPTTKTKGIADNPQSLPFNMFRALMQQDELEKKPKKMEDTFKRSSTVTNSVDG